MTGRCTTWIALRAGDRAAPAALRVARGRGVVVELDLARGDLAWRARVDARTNLADLVAMPVDQVGADAVAAATWTAPDGTRVLPGPCCAELGEVVTSELVTRVLEVLLVQGNDVHVVVDGAFDARALAACALAERVVLVGRAGAHADHVAARTRDLLARCGVTAPVERAGVGGRGLTPGRLVAAITARVVPTARSNGGLRRTRGQAATDA